MDQLTVQAESSYRTLRKVTNVIAAIVFTALFVSFGYGFYSFRVSRIDVGKNLQIDTGATESENYTCDNAPTLVIHYRGIPPKSIRAKVDDKELKLSRQGLWGTLSANVDPMKDGKHTVNVLAGPYNEKWTFIVDTVVPTINLRGPANGAVTSKDSTTFYGATKPFSTLAVKVGDQTTRTAIGADGKFNFTVPIAQGNNSIKWAVADRAGNAISGDRSVICDQTPPSIEPTICSLDGEEKSTPKTQGYTFSERNLVLKLAVKDPDTGIKSTSYSLDGKSAVQLAIPEPGEDAETDEEADSEDKKVESTDKSSAVEENSQSLDDVATSIDETSFIQTQANPDEVSESMPDSGNSEASDAPTGTADDENQATATMEDRPAPKATPTPLAKTSAKALVVKSAPLLPNAKGRSTEYIIPLNHLYDGDHTLSITSTNGVGTANKRVMKFRVNSTDKFGEATLYLGATGADVEELQKRLVNRGYLEGDYKEGTYDEATKNAVIALQRHIGADPDGICGPMVYGAIDKRIYVNLSQYEAKLVTEDEKVYTYPICIGVDKHPTPTGWFYIADMAKDPTWLPPNSEWAKDAKVIEPGPDNPLGTRWIGLDNSSIGFHGTPYPDSVGSKASHGCMRMRLVDVEDLYDRVSVGTQVRIYAGDESDANLHHYWH